MAKANDFGLKEAEDEDPDNLKAIVQSVQEADIVIYAAGVGKAKSKVFQHRREQVLTALRPYEGKLHCLTNEGQNQGNQLCKGQLDSPGKIPA